MPTSHGWKKMPQVGIVILKNKVEVGSGSTIASIVFLQKLEAASGKKIIDMFDMFIGTSAGSFNAACFAFGGLSADKVKKYWSRQYLDKIMHSSFFPG